MRPLTRSCLLLLLLGRFYLVVLSHLLGTCHSSLESALSYACSRSNPPSRQGAVLAHLDSLPSHDLVISTDGSVPFPFGKGGPGVLANCSLFGAGPLFSIRQAQYVQVFSAEACAILHALCWSRQHQQVCHFSSPAL